MTNSKITPHSPARPRPDPTTTNANPDAATQLGITEGELVGVAALWVRLDPGLDWLADARMALPLHMWRWQLLYVSNTVATTADPRAVGTGPCSLPPHLSLSRLQPHLLTNPITNQLPPPL